MGPVFVEKCGLYLLTLYKTDLNIISDYTIVHIVNHTEYYIIGYAYIRHETFCVFL